jgi:hypothetical protein
MVAFSVGGVLKAASIYGGVIARAGELLQQVALIGSRVQWCMLVQDVRAWA